MRLLYNARIYTQDARRPVVSALAIDRGVVAAAGSDDEILHLAQAGDQKEDMGEAVIWPGLTDAHLHLEYYSLGLTRVDCETSTRAECLRRVAERAGQTPAGEWVLGHGWNQNEWAEGFGDGRDLDRAAPHHPVHLTSKSVHASWANALALQAAGITANTPDPQGGRIERDSHGQPTGFLFESAMELVEKIIPMPSVHILSEAIERAQQNLWGMGLTGVHDFDRARSFGALQILNAEKRLKMRVVKSIPLESLQEAAAVGLRGGFGNDFLWIGSVKLFADGALGPHTAAMLSPYENEPDNTGMLFLDAEQFFEYGQQAAQAGLGLAIHAIGDRANHEVLEAYQQLRAYEAANHLPALRHRIEHAQNLHPMDQKRLAEMNIIASMQPIHATSDMFAADQYWGPRAANAYVFKTLLESGAALAFGSDAPVEVPNPFVGIHAAVTRQRANGQPDAQGWYPQQRLSLQEALNAYTLGPAFAAGREHFLGKLASGYAADLIVLKADPFQMDPTALHAVLPQATMVAGEWVWHA